MKTKWLVCRAFLERTAKDKSETFATFLPPAEKESFLASKPLSTELCLGFDRTQYLLYSMHYSWIALYLRTLPKQEIALFLALFSQEKNKSLRDYLLFLEPQMALTPLAQSFLLQKLSRNIFIKEDLLPIDALPPSPLNLLLQFSAENIHTLCEFLGLRDLAIELSQIIDTIRLKQIYAALSKEKWTYLNVLLQKQEPVSFKKMEIHKGPLEAETLLLLLYKRGMNRLAKALYTADKSLVWYVSHQMSGEQASLFFPLHKKLESPKAHSVLIDQVLEVSSFIKKQQAQAAS